MARRRGRGRISPTGPYRAESSVKSIRSKATPAERRKLTRDRSRLSRRVRRLLEGDRREVRAAERSTRRRPSARETERRVNERYEAIDREVPRSLKTLARAERRLERHEDKKLRESTRRLRRALAAEAAAKARRPSREGSGGFPEPGLKDLAPAAHRRASRAAIRTGSSGGLGEPEDLTTAITLATPGAGAVAAVGRKVAQQGGKEVAKTIGGAAARRVEATSARTKSRVLNTGSGVGAGGRAAGRVAKRAAGKGVSRKGTEKAARARLKRIERRRRAAAAAERSRAASAAVPGLKMAKVSVAGTPAVRGHVEALVDSPKKTTKTTLRALPGLVTQPVGVAIAGGMTGGRAVSTAAHELGVPGAKGYTEEEITAPLAGEIKQTIAFAREVAKVITATDSKMVKREVEDNLGLMLPIMLGLGAGAGTKKVTKGRVTEAVRRLVERSRENRGKAHGHRGGKAPRVLERAGQRKESAKTVAKGRQRVQLELNDRQQPMLEAARQATHSEVVRKGVARGKRGKAVDLVIRDADVASFLQRHPMPMHDPVKMFAEVQRIKAGLKEPPKGTELSPDKLSTRDVIAYIERRPDVLASPAVRKIVAEYRAQGARARKDPELAPEHSDRARFLSAATTRKIPFPEERYPEWIRGEVRTPAKRGQVAKETLRKEAREDHAEAKALRRKAGTAKHKANVLRGELATREKLNKTHLEQPLADWQVKELKAVKELERRGLIAPGTAPVGGHLQVVTPSKGSLPTKTLPKHHDRMRDRIDKLDTEAAELRERANATAEMAKRKNRAAKQVDPRLTDEFVGEVKATLLKEGVSEADFPEYQYAGPGRDHSSPTHVAQLPGKSKHRSGFAEEHGIVEEGLRPMIRDSISRPLARRESYKAAREVLRVNRFEPGGKRVWSAQEADELFSGANPPLSDKQWVKVPLQFSKRIEDVLGGKARKFTEADFTFVAQLKDLNDSGVKGTKYEIVRKAAMDEMVDQMTNSLISPTLAKANRATSFLILGTSPAWAAMQVVAEYGQAAVAQPRLLNPGVVKKAMREYKAMDPKQRQDFDSWVGVPTRTIERAEDLKLDLKAGDMEAAHNAYKTLEKTPYGRFIRGIPTSIQRIDAWKGGRIRSLTAIAKIDKDLNGRANRMLRGVGGLHREMGAALKEMQGKPLKEQVEWVASHPEWSKRYQGYLDDVLGNWSALTKRERVAAQAMIFYPFVRMSLRWTFYAFPKHHPIKAAMLYYLGQQNASEVDKLLRGDPSYFSQWATVYVDTGNGDKAAVDLARIAPGSNALIEALGGSAEGPKGMVAARVAQPALGALGTAIYGVTPLSGKQESNSGLNALAQLLPTSLSAPGRVATEALLPSGRKRAEGLPAIPGMPTERREALDRLSAELREYGTWSRRARQVAVPPLPKDAGKERDSVVLGRVMKAFAKNSSTARDEVSAKYATRMKNAVMEGKRGQVPRLRAARDARLVAMEAEYDEADRVLDRLFDRYGIEHAKEDRLFLDFYGEGKYGTTRKKSGGGFGSKLEKAGSSGGYGSRLNLSSSTTFGENLK